MTRSRFALLTALVFILYTVAIGIRGLEKWRLDELVFYYALLATCAYEAHWRFVRPSATGESPPML